MSAPSVAVAVVGLGFGSEFVPIYLSHPDVERVVMVDPDAGRRESLAAAYGIDPGYAALEDALADPDVTAVHILTPVFLHAEMVLAALGAGKHVACAVPMATTLEDIDRILEAQRTSGTSYMMMETTVYAREYFALQAMYAAGELGELTLHRGFHIQNLDGFPTYWQGYPPMHYLTHALSPILALLGTSVESVTCHGAGRLAEHRRTGGFDNPYPTEVGLFSLRGRDVLADITMSFSQTARSYVEGFSIYGDRRGVEWPIDNEGPLTVFDMYPPAPDRRGNRVETSSLAVSDVTFALPPPLRQFVRPSKLLLPGMAAPVSVGADHGGSHPFLVHEFVRSIVTGGEPALGPRRSAAWTSPGVCAHRSALEGGARTEVPDLPGQWVGGGDDRVRFDAMSRIVALRTADVRFPTSQLLDGSDAMNKDPDYSAAYVELVTDAGDGLSGHGFTFTTGRGNDLQVAAIRVLEPMLLGRDVETLLSDLGEACRSLVYDSHLRWLGPEKGVVHMAIGAVVNAIWDLAAKRAGQPLWRFLAAMEPEQIVDLVDFRYLTDAMSPAGALDLLSDMKSGRAERIETLQRDGFPAYATSPGWLGYSDEKLERLAREAVEDGFTQIKLKVGGRLEDDIRRLGIARAAVGPGVRIAIDANQRWDVAEAITWVRALDDCDLAWVEEPTSPDDVLGHAAIARGIAPIPVATGEHMANRVMAKQFLQADALSVLQIDATRVAGVNENVAMLLLAAQFGVPVCPHAGGVGLCEVVQHLAMFDYVAVSGTMDGRMIEYVDHLHEHFVAPVVVVRGRYRAPETPGSGAEMLPGSIEEARFTP